MALPSSAVPLFASPARHEAGARSALRSTAPAPSQQQQPQPQQLSPRARGTGTNAGSSTWTTAELKRRGQPATVERIPQSLLQASKAAGSSAPKQSPHQHHQQRDHQQEHHQHQHEQQEQLSLSRPVQFTHQQRRLFAHPGVVDASSTSSSTTAAPLGRPGSGRRGWTEGRRPQYSQRGVAVGAPASSGPSAPTRSKSSTLQVPLDATSRVTSASARSDMSISLFSDTESPSQSATQQPTRAADTLGRALAHSRHKRLHPPKTPLHEIIKVELGQIVQSAQSRHHLKSGSRPITSEPSVSYVRVATWTPELIQQAIEDQSNEHDVVRQRGVTLTEGVVDATIRPPPQDVMEGLEACLDDRVFLVKFHAAVSWICLRGLDDKPVAILRRTMTKDSGALRWAAARCLASADDNHPTTIDALVEHIARRDSEHHAEAYTLLVQLAHRNPDVIVYATNLLTDDDSKVRRAAVQVLPSLATFLPTDLAHKLVTMMWDDWDTDVRDACFTTLTSAGHTHLVYDSLELRLTSTADRVRCDALRKIGHLGTYPRRIQPHFLNCFRDPYASVRSCAAWAAANLRAISHSIEVALYDLVAKDENAKIRLDGVNALRQLRVNTPRHQGLLVWIVQYEGQPALVEAACQTIIDMDMRANADLRKAVLWRSVNAESAIISDVTQRCREAMEWSEDDDIAREQFEQIRSTLAQLSTKDNILKEITDSPRDPLGLRTLFKPKKQKTTTPTKQAEHDKPSRQSQGQKRTSKKVEFKEQKSQQP
ncbi:hypothetical protein PTSG_07260 [Salpingoeca rosetta]|uniref:Uncharacterized protein n=1 Tax=Salpingoeca rosetta (strain ATCC 50818 / BSB-021) TaxID=946362 RepID=F2UEI5_SALR5|nr:uncharacterized protein PTSG_07260 [Salpingoeca rosetta]EGD75035.1 hypothetical protein PTSG_07260 [Salpingoeca rosetta]|eukprot:XP_004992679.1 hypothetical protein PTSG_07260 [Salpingoeca rosetta]